jgi:SP family general alpha glucoside:H+ symporter-like MFS transporter
LVIQAVGSRASRSAYMIPIGTQWCFSLAILVLLPFCPESPWVLVKQGKIEQAKKSLARLYGKTDDDLDQHLRVIEDTLEFEAKLHANSAWPDMFK